MRDWVKAYNNELQSKSASTEIGDDLAVMKLLSNRWGRPCPLREKIDTEVQTTFRAMRDNGPVVNISIAIATATGVVRKRDKSLLKENGGALEQMLTKNWAKSLLYRSTGGQGQSSS